jgi:hypothetical protein
MDSKTNPIILIISGSDELISERLDLNSVKNYKIMQRSSARMVFELPEPGLMSLLAADFSAY